MRMGAPSGAPRSNENALKNGLYSREAFAEGKRIRELVPAIAQTGQVAGPPRAKRAARRPIPTIFGRRAGRNPRCCGRNAGARELTGVMTLPFTRAPVYPNELEPPIIYRRLGHPDHHGHGRGCACASVAGKAR
jgi:hypothetical protein